MRQLARFLVVLLPLLPGLAPPAQAELSSGDRQAYREAFQAVRSGDWAAAGQRADKAQDGLLAKVLWWLNLSREGSGATFAEITGFVAANPDWPSGPVLRQHADESTVGVPDNAVSEWYDRFPPVTAAGKLRQARRIFGCIRGPCAAVSAKTSGNGLRVLTRHTPATARNRGH